MGFRLYPIFIKCHDSLYSDKDILNMIGLSDLKKIKTVNFYQTSKQEKDIFIGTKGNCKILCNRELAYSAFEENNVFLQFKNCEVASTIWDETSSISGFSIINNGKIIRKVLSFEGDIKHNFGSPIQEELEIDEENVFPKDEEKEIFEHEGIEGLKSLIRERVIDIATDNLVKRYIGERLLNIREKIEMNKYE